MEERSENMTRQGVAELLGMHADSVTRNLHSGLSCAVLEWGGRGQSMTFARGLTLRWWRAKSCVKSSGSPCAQCKQVLEDCVLIGRHLRNAKHSAGDPCGEHEACSPMPPEWEPMWPCSEGRWVAPELPDDGLAESAAIATKFGVSYFTVAAWIADGMPTDDLARGREWLEERGQLEDTGDAIGLVRERARKERAMALLAEQRLAERAGKLLRVDDVRETWSGEVSAVRTLLLSWPTVLATRLERAFRTGGVHAVERELKAAVYEVLTQLSEGNHDPPKSKTAPRKKKAGKKKAPKKKAAGKRARRRSRA